MPLVAPGVARFSVIARLSGELCVNVLDVHIDAALGQARDDEIFLTAGDILNNWTDHILPLLTSAYQAIEVRYVDLNSEGGIAGSRSSTSAETWPAEGGASGAPSSNNVTARVTKVLEGRGRNQRNGRMALGGLLESHTAATDGNRLDTTFAASLDVALEEFKDGINGADGLGTRNLVVVHTVNDDYVDRSEISVFRVEPIVGTLRRRMPGYGD